MNAQGVIQAFAERFGAPPRVLVRAPGRVALLGAHIDDAGGCVMPAAIDRAIYLAAAPSRDRTSRIVALDLDQEREISQWPLPLEARGGSPEMSWIDLPAGVYHQLRKTPIGMSQIDPQPMDVVFGGDLPAGAGVSSSAAVIVAFVLAWHELSSSCEALDRVAAARFCQRVENQHLGVRAGLMDPFASLHGESDQVIFLDCRSAEHSMLPLPASTAVVVVDSGIRRQLATSGFNDRRQQCALAVDLLRQELRRRELPGIETLRDVSPANFETTRHVLPDEVAKRAQHVVYECQRVVAAADDLRQGDVEAFGKAMVQSHKSSRDLYGVSLPALDLLCETAWAEPGCFGAKLMGGGFGGCVALLTQAEKSQEILDRVSARYEKEVGEWPRGFVTRLSQGATATTLPTL